MLYLLAVSSGSVQPQLSARQYEYSFSIFGIDVPRLVEYPTHRYLLP
jgi:hypothetical protein